MTVLVLVTGLIWLVILLHQIAHRGFLVLIVWLLIAPVMSNLVNDPGGNPLFNFRKAQETIDDVQMARAAFLRPESNPIRLNQLLEPTRSLLGGFLVIFILAALLKKKHLGPFDKTEVWMGIFSIILLTNIVLYSTRLHFSMRVASDAFIIPFMSYCIVRRLVTDESRFDRFSRIMAYLGVYLIIIEMIEQFVHQGFSHKLAGPFKSSVSLFIVTMVTFFTVLLNTICSYRFSWRQQFLPQGIRWFVLFLSPVVIFFTFSRGNWVGFFVGLWIFLFMAHRKMAFSLKLGMLGLALTTVPLIIIGHSIWIPPETIETEISGTNTIYGRIATWLIAIKIGTEYPITGIGLNDLRIVLHETQMKFNGVANFGSVHNSFLALFAEQGLVGLLAYLALVVSIIQKGLQLYRTGTLFQDQWRGITVIAVFTAYLTPALFASTLHDHKVLTHLYVYVFIGAISGLHSQHERIPYLSTPIGSSFQAFRQLR
jgi:O-antigen ligase